MYVKSRYGVRLTTAFKAYLSILCSPVPVIDKRGGGGDIRLPY